MPDVNTHSSNYVVSSHSHSNREKLEDRPSTGRWTNDNARGTTHEACAVQSSRQWQCITRVRDSAASRECLHEPVQARRQGPRTEQRPAYSPFRTTIRL
ncbi:hypothetical protein L226DRAFT_540621, partial [Lentinus tigrinus ALCF2SS1-7]|uniref:uncharacterized protein n=1 Tax=Lentinus tigrinus ALCF2SS1-7 TaxID=1328758 RepID=UPI00116610D7